MLLTITICLTVLVAFNFLLLKFSCSKTNKRQKIAKKPIVFTPRTTRESASTQLAPTGS